jgi:hypothetical protein
MNVVSTINDDREKCLQVGLIPRSSNGIRAATLMTISPASYIWAAIELEAGVAHVQKSNGNQNEESTAYGAQKARGRKAW